MKERIQKILASAGVASRRQVEEMVRQGRIVVNGRVITDLPILIDPRADKVEVDGQRLRLAESVSEQRLYFILNKPKGVYCTNVAQGEQRRAIDLLPPNLGARLYPVGRLDAESKGLLLMTNDGELTNRLTHPRYGVEKTYRAIVDGFVTPETMEQMQRGVWLADESGRAQRSSQARLKIVRRSRQQSILEIRIREGKNRPVRRVLAKLGHKVRDLTRIRLGPLTLDKLAPGQFRPLNNREIKALKQLGQKPPVALTRSEIV
jgi:23S rRNA pseudouridine2605 synthase